MSSELLRPRSVTELLDVAFALIRAHFPVFATLAVVTALPVLVTLTATLTLLPDGATSVASDGANSAAQAASAGLSLTAMLIIVPLTILAWLWFFVAGSSLIFATGDAYRGQPVDAGAAFRRAMRATGDILGASIAKYIAIIGIVFITAILAGILAAIQPVFAALAVFGGIAAALLLSLRWFVVTAVAALEDVTGSDALGRSMRLTTGAAGRIFLIGVVIFVLAGCLSTASAFALGFAGSAVLAGLANSLWLLLYPFVNVIEAVTYFDQRIRTEGFDLEVMAQQLGPTAAAGSAFSRPSA